MPEMKKRYLWIGLAVAALGSLAWFFFVDRVPSSLSEALLNRQDEFPAQQFIILPPSTQTRLGRQVDGDPDESRRVSTRAVPCFFVAPTSSEGLRELLVQYDDSRQLAGDWGNALGAVSGDLRQHDRATVTLRNLKIQEGIGVPILNSPCTFTDGAKFSVVSSQVTAETVEVTFATALSGNASGSVVPAEAGPKASAQGGWVRTGNTTVKGEGVVLSGGLQEVSVSVKRFTDDQGTAPSIGKQIPFPEGFDGAVVIDGFDDSTRTLTIRGAVPLGRTQVPSPDFATCQPSASVALRPAERCEYWLNPGNALVSVDWSYVEVAGVRHVVMTVTGYRTSFAPP